MDMKRLVIGTVVGGITMSAVGYLIWNVAFDYWGAGFVAAGVARESPLFLQNNCRMSQLLSSLLSLWKKVVPRQSQVESSAAPSLALSFGQPSVLRTTRTRPSST